MSQLEAFLEKTWEGILSGDPQKIAKTFYGLDETNRHIVLEHLKKMAGQAGWQPGQVKAAQTALGVILAEGKSK